LSPHVTPTQTWPDVPQRCSAWRASQGVLQRIRHGLRQRLRLCRLRAADLGDDQLSSSKVVASPGFHPAKMVVKHQKPMGLPWFHQQKVGALIWENYMDSTRTWGSAICGIDPDFTQVGRNVEAWWI